MARYKLTLVRLEQHPHPDGCMAADEWKPSRSLNIYFILKTIWQQLSIDKMTLL